MQLHHRRTTHRLGLRHYLTLTLPLHRHRPALPIAAFVDLDNVIVPKAKAVDANNCSLMIVNTLIEFERHVNNNNMDRDRASETRLLRIEAFGNGSTNNEHINLLLLSEDEKYNIPWTNLNEDDDEEEEEGHEGIRKVNKLEQRNQGLQKRQQRKQIKKRLERAADEWMEKAAAVCNGDDDNKEEEIDTKTNDAQNDREKIKGVLLVYSKDDYFIRLLERARKRGFLAVSATNEVRQTEGLLQCSHVVLGPFGRWMEDYEDFDAASPFSIENSSPDEHVRYEGHVIRKVSHAPISLLSLEAHDTTVQAVPVSDDGYHFMRRRQCHEPSDGNEFPTTGVHNSVRWHLSNGSKVCDDPSIHDILVKEEQDSSLEGGESEDEEDDGPVVAGEPRSRRYMCKDCGQQSTRWGRLKLHMRSCAQCATNNSIISARTPENCAVDDANDNGHDNDEHEREDGNNDSATIISSKDKKKVKRKKRSYGGLGVPEMYIVRTKKMRKKKNNITSLISSPSSLAHRKSIISIVNEKEKKLKEKQRKRRQRRYQCGDCGNETKSWGVLRKYMKQCTLCTTPDFRKIHPRKYEVRLK